MAAAQTAHLQAAQADPQTQACKRANFAIAQRQVNRLKNVF